MRDRKNLIRADKGERSFSLLGYFLWRRGIADLPDSVLVDRFRLSVQ